MTALIIILGLIGVLEFAAWCVYGTFVNSNEFIKVIEKHETFGVRLNQYDKNIINIGDLPYIAVSPPSLFCKWHIDGIGRVWRWSKLHNRINAIHKKELYNL